MGEELSLLILAAGKGKRMHSARPKALHELCGRPILEYILEATAPLKAAQTVVVIGHQGERVRERFAERGLIFVEQREQLGTGHAALQARPALEGRVGEILILPGDLPLLQAELLEEFLAFHRAHGGRLSLLTMELADPRGYGRVVRGRDGAVLKVVEDRDASEEERPIREVNSGVYLIRNEGLFWEALAELDAINAQGEYYLPDIVRLYRQRGEPVRALLARESEPLLGINSKAELAQAEAVLRRRKLAEVLAAGATVVAPETVIIEPTASVARDARIGPSTTIGQGSRIGEAAVVESSRIAGFEIGEGCRIKWSIISKEER